MVQMVDYVVLMLRFIFCLFYRLSPVHPGLGECMPKVYICLRSAAEPGIVEPLVCAELA